jgi:hypothetical protein
MRLRDVAMIAAAAPALTGCAAPGLPAYKATLSRHDSATAALEEWCAARGIAHNSPVTATMIAAATLAGEGDDRTAEWRKELAVGPNEPVGFRHVRLECGGVVLSEAYNWYVPALLTPEMNRELAATRMPFGKVAAPLGYRRELIESADGQSGGCPPGIVLSHKAMLRLPDGRALALLVECYTEANLTR